MSRLRAMMRPIPLLLIAALAACGPNDAPVQPSVNSSVTLGTDGVSASTGVALRKGWFRLGLHL